MYKLYKKSGDSEGEALYWDAKYTAEQIGRRDPKEFERQLFWPLLQQHLQSGGRYLDVGCGAGGWLFFLKDQNYNVAGIDIASHTVKAIRKYDSSVDIQTASIVKIPHTDSSFDGVIALGTLEYAEDTVPQALQEVRRVLKPGGFLFIEVPLLNPLRRLLYVPLKRIKQLLMPSRQQAFANYLFTRTELGQLLEEAGFEVVQEQPHELPEQSRHYGLWIDWKFLRGRGEPYKLNALGRVIKNASNAISPWIASTGVVMMARKKGS